MPGSVRAIRRALDPVRGRGRIPLSKRRTPGNPEFRTTGSPDLSRLEQNIADALVGAVDAIPHEMFLDAVQSGDVAEYGREVLDTLAGQSESIEAALMASYVASGEAAAIEIGNDLAREYRRVGKAVRKADAPSPSEVALRFRFDKTDPRAIDWVRRESGAMITNMVRSEQEAIRSVIDASFSAQQTVQQTGRGILGQLRTVNPSAGAREFADTLGSNLNGLTRRYETAVVNRVTALADDLADRGITGTKALEQMRKEGDRYAERLRKARSRTIARTERMRAHNQARLLSFQQAIDSGIASAEHSRKQWKTGPFDVCEICVAMQGQERKVAETFTLPNGGQVDAPPAHPNCRCTMTMRTDTRLYQPPENLGTGTLGDPFRTAPRDFTDTGRRAAGQGLPGTPAPPAPTPTAPTPAPAPPPPEAPLRIDVDDLRPRTERIRGRRLDEVMETDANGKYRRTRSGVTDPPTVGDVKLNAYDMVATQDGADALDAVLDAGKRALDTAEREIARRTSLIQPQIDEGERLVKEAREAYLKAQDDISFVTRKAVLDEIKEIGDAADDALRERFYFLREEVADRWASKGGTSHLLDDDVVEELVAALRELPPEHPVVQRILRVKFGLDDTDDLAELARTWDLSLTQLRDEQLNAYTVIRYFGVEPTKREAAERAATAVDEALEAVRRATDPLNKLRAEARRIRIDVLEELLTASRPGFGTGSIVDKFSKIIGRTGRDRVGRGDVRDAMDRLARRMPREWADNIISNQDFGFVQRGYYSERRRRLRVSGSTSADPVAWAKDSWQATLHHEMQHATQATQSMIRNLERLLLSRRAQARAAEEGASFWKIQRIYRGSDEWYLDVGLGDKYLMKHYPGTVSGASYDGFTEVSTRGMERLWYEDWDSTDPDVLRLMLGMLLLV